MTKLPPPIPPNGTIFVTMHADGSCDWCGDIITDGELTRFDGFGDACSTCIIDLFAPFNRAWATFWGEFAGRLDEDQKRSYKLDQIDGILPPRTEDPSMHSHYGSIPSNCDDANRYPHDR